MARSMLWMGLLFCCTVFSSGVEAGEATQPNFIVVLADDLGYADLRCYGNESLRTPHIDRFAAEGLRLTSCYAAAANCSPARAGLMTGRMPYRVGIYNWIPMDSPVHLRRSEVTVATLLRKAGYDTAMAGKWHLSGGLDRVDQPQPGDHGFNHWFATQNNALPNHRNPHNFFRNGDAVGKVEGYASHVIVDEAVRWLGEGRDKSLPFFLYVAFHEPHEPIASDPQYASLYPSDDPSYAAHHGNITQMDAAFGRLMRAVDEMKLRDSTFVVFTSDNGPAKTAVHPQGSAGPLRDRKGSVYEGGVRVPGIVRWPGRVGPGGVSDEPVSGVDLLPTLCGLAGVDVPAGRAIDGVSITPVFSGKPLTRKTPLYWQHNRTRSDKHAAMRIGRWKILASLDLKPDTPVDITEQTNDVHRHARLTDFVLYDLQADPGESRNLADQQPQRLAEMTGVMTRIHRQLQLEGPVWEPWVWSRHEGRRVRQPDYWLNRRRK